MARPTHVQINSQALLHNLNQVKRLAPHSKIIPAVKANAYGCGIKSVVPVLEGQGIYAFGVACLEEAIAIRDLGVRSPCLLLQGVFSPEELNTVATNQFQLVVHQPHQLQWLLNNPLPGKIKVWVKINTGMHRLGFAPEDSYEVINALSQCPWVEEEIGVMTHFASADERENPSNQNQLSKFRALELPRVPLIKSIANSAGLLAFPEAQVDVVRPGIMLYGISPFSQQTGQELGLSPVMRFVSAISAIHHYPAKARIGYGGTWQTNKPSIIGVVAAGYGDGYPRHVAENTPVWIKGQRAPIVGRISMDMLTVDLTSVPEVKIGEPVELWGLNIPVETIALSAGTIAYELICQVSPRAHCKYG